LLYLLFDVDLFFEKCVSFVINYVAILK